MRFGMIALFAFLAACSPRPEDIRTYRYPNSQGTAAVVVDVEYGGGAAGFVINRISLEAAGKRIDEIRTLEHMAQTNVFWNSEHHARFCFVGTMDRGTPHWAGSVNGQDFQIDFLIKQYDQTCT